MTTVINFEVVPGGILEGEIFVPGDKSISHRSVILASLSKGVSEICGILDEMC